jgi:PTH1 family peptidyl-tRNA hydrolase
MKVIIGLGNPGKKYEKTRHNTGFMFCDLLAKKKKWDESRSGKLKYIWLRIGNEDIELVKPQIFMNQSGLAALYIRKKHPGLSLSDLYIVHDDLDLPLGEYKIQFAKGPKQHNGLLSTEQHLKSKDFWRVRIGIRGERYDKVRVSQNKSLADDYLLKPFTKKERLPLHKIIEGAIKELLKQFL